MIIYEVTTDVSLPHVAAYEAYLRATHIPDVLATGCFTSAVIECAIPGRYRIRYAAQDMDVLDTYLARHAAQLRADFATHLEGCAVNVSREVWAELEHWPGSRAVP